MFSIFPDLSMTIGFLAMIGQFILCIFLKGLHAMCLNASSVIFLGWLAFDISTEWKLWKV